MAPQNDQLGPEDDDAPELDPTGGAGLDDQDPQDEPEDGDEEYVPPSKDEWERTQAALKRANDEAKKHRLKARELSRTTDGASDDKAQQAAEAAEKRFKPIAIRSAAKAAFLEAGLNDASSDQLKRLMRLVDMDEVDVDDDGDVIGLAEQVDDIKGDFPSLFKAPERKRAPRLDASNRQSNGQFTPKTTGEKIAAQVLGR